MFTRTLGADRSKLGRPTGAGLRRRAGALALPACLGLTLAACGDHSKSDAPSAVQTARNGDVFNDADVQFASEMIQHHAQALVMVDMAAGRPLDPAVQKLTGQIRDAQGPEIEIMTDWLTAWDQEIPETMRDHSNAGHDMDHDLDGMESDMAGTVTVEEMDELQSASDAEFQHMWLQLMVEHHEGAIEMAQAEQAEGVFDDAIALAQRIESGQQRAITKMDELLG